MYETINKYYKPIILIDIEVNTYFYKLSRLLLLLKVETLLITY